MYGIELAYLIGKKYTCARNDLLKKVKAVSAIANIPEIMAKAEYYVRQHQDNEVIAKLKGNVLLTNADVQILEEILWNEIGTKDDRFICAGGNTGCD